MQKNKSPAILLVMNIQSVAGIVFSFDRKEVLLIQRRDVPIWVLPGGGIDANETPVEAIQREILEETGFTVKVYRLVGDYIPINRLAKRTHLYECTIIEGRATLSRESKGVAFLPLNALPPMPPPYLEWIEEAQKNSPPIQRNLISVNYRTLFRYAYTHPFLLARFLLARLGMPINSR